MVSEEKTEGRCNAMAGEDNWGYCESYPTKDDDGEIINGRCRMHGGTPDSGAPKGNQNGLGNSGGGAPKGNTNATSHGLLTSVNTFYSNVMSDELRDLCDKIYDYYTELYNRKRGHAPGIGVESRLFEIATNHIKVIYADNWANDRPKDVESGNPVVDKNETYKSAGENFVKDTEYQATVVTKMQQQLRREDRAWLKDYGLLDDPETKKAASTQSLAEILSGE